jgi:hypothetical protein
MWCLACDNSRIVLWLLLLPFFFDGGEDDDGERRGLGCIALRLLYLPIVLPPSPFSPCHRPGTIPHLVSALWIPFPVPSIRTPSLVPRRVHRYVSRSNAIFMVFLLPVLDCCHPAYLLTYLLTSWKGQSLHVRRFCWLCPSGERHCDALRNGLKFGIPASISGITEGSTWASPR